MLDTRVTELARFLQRCRQDGTQADGLPAHLRPRDRHEAYAVQLAVADQNGGVGGWKIAATTPTAQRVLAISGPLAGAVAALNVTSDEHLDLGRNNMRTAEPEVLLVLHRDLTADPDRPREAVLAAVGEIRIGWDVPDSRLDLGRPPDELDLIADGAVGLHIALGTAAPPPSVPEIEKLGEVGVTVSGRSAGVSTRSTGSTGLALGGPAEGLAWLAHELGQHGIDLLAGQVVATGTCTPPVPVRPGDCLRAEFGRLGHTRIAFDPLDAIDTTCDSPHT